MVPDAWRFPKVNSTSNAVPSVPENQYLILEGRRWDLTTLMPSIHPKPSVIYNVICTGISIIYSPLPLVDFLPSVPTLIPVDPRPNDLSIILYRDLSAAIAINQRASTETQNCTLFFSHASILSFCGITSYHPPMSSSASKQHNRNPEREGESSHCPPLYSTSRALIGSTCSSQ